MVRKTGPRLRVTADIVASCEAPQSHLNRQREPLGLTPTFNGN